MHHLSIQISPPFYGYIIRLSVCALLWPTVYHSTFPEAAFRDISDVHECIRSSLLVVQQRLPGCEVSHDLVVILSTD